MTLAKILLYIMVNATSFLTFLVYYHHITPHNDHTLKYRLICVISFIGLVFSSSAYDSVVSVIFQLLIPLFIIGVLSQAGPWKKIKYFLIYTAAYYLTYMVFFLLTTFLFDNNYLLADSNYQQYKTVIINVFIYISFSLIVNNRKIKRMRLMNPFKIQLNFLLFLTMGIQIFLIYFFAKNEMKSQEFTTTIFLAFFMNVIIIIMIISLYNKLIANLHEQSQAILKLEKYDMEKAYYTDISDKISELAYLRHDFKNHLLLINRRLQNKEYSKAIKYIASIEDIVTDAGDLIVSPNETISSILSTKKNECHKRKIQFTCNLDFEGIYLIKDLDIIILLGNILDNAIQAALDVLAPDRFIHISIIQIASHLDIVCENSYITEPVEIDGRLQTSKALEGHGLGISSVAQTVDHYNGTMDYSYADNKFTIKLSIPNY